MTNIDSHSTRLLALLDWALESDYHKQPIPSDIDQQLSTALSQLGSLDQRQVEATIEDISGDRARVLGLYAERMASQAVRENNIDHVRNGLIALLIDMRSEDLREILIVLSLLHDAAVKTAGSAQQVFKEVSSLFGGSKVLGDFLARNSNDKSIDAMGYKEAETNDGFLYVRTW